MIFSGFKLQITFHEKNMEYREFHVIDAQLKLRHYKKRNMFVKEKQRVQEATW